MHGKRSKLAQKITHHLGTVSHLCGEGGMMEKSFPCVVNVKYCTYSVRYELGRSLHVFAAWTCKQHAAAQMFLLLSSWSVTLTNRKLLPRKSSLLFQLLEPLLQTDSNVLMKWANHNIFYCEREQVLLLVIFLLLLILYDLVQLESCSNIWIQMTQVLKFNLTTITDQLLSNRSVFR